MLHGNFPQGEESSHDLALHPIDKRPTPPALGTLQRQQGLLMQHLSKPQTRRGQGPQTSISLLRYLFFLSFFYITILISITGRLFHLPQRVQGFETPIRLEFGYHINEWPTPPAPMETMREPEGGMGRRRT